MNEHISKTKIQIGLGSIFTVMLAFVGVMSYVSGLEKFQTGDATFASNVVTFPCMLAFLLSGFIVLVTKNIKALEKVCMASISLEDESKLSNFLDTISLAKRVPLITVTAILLLTGIAVPTVMSQMAHNSMYTIALFILSTLLSTAVSISVVKSEISYLLKK